MSRPQIISASIIGYKQDLGVQIYNHKDAILYAIGIGFSTDPLKTEDFKYTYQLDKNFTIFPTFASSFGQLKQREGIFKNKFLPQLSEKSILVFGDERFYMVQQSIKLNTFYKIQSQIIDIVDKGKGKGAFIIKRITGYRLDEKGQKHLSYYIIRSIFEKTLGGSQITSKGYLIPLPLPSKRQPDLILNETTFPNQSIIYRLSNAPNPLHIDPQIAKMAGYTRPIIHGLAIYGTIVRSITQNILKNDVLCLKSIQVRYTGHVFPGQSLKIKIWKENGKIVFEADTVERKAKVVVGVVELRDFAKL